MSYVFALVPLHQSYTLFPYTTLFRSICLLTAGLAGCGTVRVPAGEFASDPVCAQIVMGAPEQMLEMDRVETSSQGTVAWGSGDDTVRSEEHTSELQSRGHLVCRLLLENKKSVER